MTVTLPTSLLPRVPVTATASEAEGAPCDLGRAEVGQGGGTVAALVVLLVDVEVPEDVPAVSCSVELASIATTGSMKYTRKM